MIDFWCDIDWLLFIMAYGLWDERYGVHAPCAHIDSIGRKEKKNGWKSTIFFRSLSLSTRDVKCESVGIGSANWDYAKFSVIR